MEIYLVGGAVRDRLAGRTPKDHDWVVVGASPQQMLDLGYLQVGADFPVFLNPETHDEYALARVERKEGEGYLGFATETNGVTLEEDLARRDLTINAMAMDAAHQVVDPYGGLADLNNRVLRHVGPAFTEDPVRILRVLRFHARFGPDWTIAPETQALLSDMVASGAAASLVSERVWQEVSRALMEPHPELFLKGFYNLGLHEMPALFAYSTVSPHDPKALQTPQWHTASLGVRFALTFPQQTQGRVPPPGVPSSVWQTMALANDYPYAPATAEAWVDLVVRTAAVRNPSKFQDLLKFWDCQGQPAQRGQLVLAAVQAVDTRALTQGLPQGPAVGVAIRLALSRAVIDVLHAGPRC